MTVRFKEKCLAVCSMIGQTAKRRLYFLHMNVEAMSENTRCSTYMVWRIAGTTQAWQIQ